MPRFEGCPVVSFRPVDLPPSVGGHLWLHSMPGRFESWPDFLAEAARVRLALLVCLTPRHELALLSPCYDDALRAGALPMQWLALPMRDLGLAIRRAPFRDGIDAIAERLRDGDAALLHCAAGIGRTGTAAACLLVRLGLARDEALARVRAAGSNPESALQSGLVDAF